MSSRVTVALFAGALLWHCCPAAAAQMTGEKVVKFCKEQLGKQVGDGECTALADAALAAAGAKPRSSFKGHPQKGDYVWGQLAYTIESDGGRQTEKAVGKLRVRPGDIIQFRDAKFQGETPDGGTYTATAPQHTAVVVGLEKEGRVLLVLHQNMNNKRYVIEGTYSLDDLQEGRLRIYRPVPR